MSAKKPAEDQKPEETVEVPKAAEQTPEEVAAEADAAEAAAKEKQDAKDAAEAAEINKDLSKVTPVGEDPFVLISRNETGAELRAARVANRGILVTNGFGLVFIEGGSIVQQGGSNAITA